tara:strand:- start:181 stop:1485 length:1305 start_codon:yes stop_codon:yes gene_type:complete
MKAPRRSLYNSKNIVAFKTYLVENKTNTKEFNSYAALIRNPGLYDEVAQSFQFNVEKLLATQTGASVRGGNETLAKDVFYDDTDNPNGFFRQIFGERFNEVNKGNPAEGLLETGLELKLSRKETDKGVQIGEITAGGTRKKSQDRLTALEETGTKINTPKRVDNLRNAQGGGGKKLLEALKKTPAGQMFYNKSSALTLTKMITVNGERRIEATTLLFPYNKFKVPPFKASIDNVARFLANPEKNSLKIAVSLSDSFEKNLISQLKNELGTEMNKDFEKNLKEKFNRKAKRTLKVGSRPGNKGAQLRIDIPTGGSIPMSTINITPPKKKNKTKQSPAQSFISGVALSALVQKRLTDSMDTTGIPNPPDLKNRSGRFISSVQVFPNYRKSLISYTINPLYRSLESYGYTPGEQTVTAIRQVVAAVFARNFLIVRAN